MNQYHAREPVFPTPLHHDVANLVGDYFSKINGVDTVLVVNSCARGQAVPESDLDMAILMKPQTSTLDINTLEKDWLQFASRQDLFLKFKQSSPYAQVHLDLIEGQYTPGLIANGEPLDYFEVEIGNQVCYAAHIGKVGDHFIGLKKQWLPYYSNELRQTRLTAIHQACEYDLDHIPFFVRRGLYFHALDVLHQAFQKYLQALFIRHKTYPIAYNKWIKEQIVGLLKLPDLYHQLPPLLSISDIESTEINDKAMLLKGLLHTSGL